MPEIVSSEDDWRAEDDARTITQAEAIKVDPKRFKKAQEAAKRLYEEEKARTEALKKLANAKMDYTESPMPEK